MKGIESQMYSPPLPVNRAVEITSAQLINGVLNHFRFEFEAPISRLYVVGHLVAGSPPSVRTFRVTQGLISSGVPGGSGLLPGEDWLQLEDGSGTSADIEVVHEYVTDLRHSGCGVFRIESTIAGSSNPYLTFSVLGVSA
jgi:hypothetical protein